MGMMILQYRKRIVLAFIALMLTGGGFMLGRLTEREPEQASGLSRMNEQVEAALHVEPKVTKPSASLQDQETEPATEPAAKAAVSTSPLRSSESEQKPAEAAPSQATEVNTGTVPTSGSAPATRPTDQTDVASAAGGIIPAPSEPSAAPVAAETRASGLLDLNTATLEELMELPRIGETKAKAILQYREQHGGFRSASEITEVKGIGEKTYESFKDRITVIR
ncbi:ComEA family DNA-binding protein [Gorillibacterium timonense]|uniref:ComEA family DNA-binding protein n=1 Tax=Gorillibacterium timonense TaxID=1689269 RepID=UPI00071D973C|nr:helix-hairpin-helix domain-containing protein [Gorillibacterium timonense]